MTIISLADPYIHVPTIVVPPISEVRLTSTTTNGTSQMVTGQEIQFRDSGGIGGPYASNENYRYTFENTTGSGFELTVVDFQFEQYSSSQYDRLGWLESSTGSTYANVTVSWWQTSLDPVCPWSRSFGGTQWNSTGSYPGYILPATVSRAQSSPLNWDGTSKVMINQPYLRACFFSDGSSNWPGWDITIKAL